MRLPYPGLRPFRHNESDLFFGREGCVDQMVDRLAATRFLAVLGPSGSGKSSLVLTGLHDALEIGLCARAGSRWRLAYMHPGARPIENLARGLLLPTDEGNPISNLDVELLSSYLRRGPRSIVEWCTDGNLDAGTNLLVVVDQFEELFRYRDYAGREEAEAFVALLSESARSAEAAIYVTITMRSEYLGACALLPDLADRINAGLYLVPRMTRDEVREAIVGPAGVCGFTIEPALVNRLLNDLEKLAPWEDDPGSDQLQRLSGRADQLPLMQHVLNRMSLRAAAKDDKPIELRVADYDQAGGLTGALDAHAREVFDSLAEADRPLVETVFRALVSGTTIENAVRRPCRFGDLVVLANGDQEAVSRVVNTFRGPECNFLMPAQDIALRDDTIIDISHESLIRQWSALRDWVRQEFESAQRYRHLEASAQLWDKGEAGLLRRPELDVAQDWRQREQPTAVWAARYGGDWGLALRFLDASGRRHTLLRAVAGLVGLVVIGSTAFLGVEYYLTITKPTQFQQDLQKARSLPKDANLADELTDFHVPPQDMLQSKVSATTPLTLQGATVVSTRDLGEIGSKFPPPVWVDALADAHGFTIPPAMRIPFAGKSGDWTDLVQRRLKVRLDNLTNDNRDATLIFFCLGTQCWESYNASLRAIHAGYTRVYWYRGGLDSWQDAGYHFRHPFEKTQELKDQLSKPEAISPKQRWGLAVSLSEIGEEILNEAKVKVSDVDTDSVISSETLARDQLKKLEGSLPDNIDLLSDLVASEIRLASAFEVAKKFDMADTVYDDLESVQRRIATLAENQPDSQLWLSDISATDRQIGLALFGRDKFSDAAHIFHMAEAVDRILADKEPDNSQFEQDLARDYLSVGLSLEFDTQYDSAITNLRNGQDIIKKLANSQPESANWQHQLSFFYQKIGEILNKQERLSDALAAYQEAANLANTALEKDSADSQWKNDLHDSTKQIGDLAYKLILAKDFVTALDATNFALSRASDAVWINAKRAHALMFLGHVQEARQVYLEFRGRKAQGEKLWEDDVKDDFADLRKHGLSDPLMDQIEKTFHAS